MDMLDTKIDPEELKSVLSEISEFENYLKNIVKEQSELKKPVETLQEILTVVSQEIESAKDLKKIDKRKEISVLAHIALLHQIMDMMEGSDEDMDFDEDFDEEDGEEFEYEDEDEEK